MKDKSLGKKILYVFIAIVFAAICFGAGFLTRMFTQSSAVSSYSWALDTIRQYYYQDIPEGDITNLTLKQLAYYYLDKYSAYYTAEEFASVTASNAGSKSGIGIRSDYVNASVGKGIYINSVVFNSPAYYAGLSAGTIITNVKYTNSDGSESSVEINSYSDFTSCLNSRNTNEDFTLITSQGDYTISKQNYTAGYCLMSTNSAAWTVAIDDGELYLQQADDSRVVTYLPDGCAYLSFSEFYGYAANEMAMLFSKFNDLGCTSLILDLRSNGGGYVETMQYISSLFTSTRSDASSVAMVAKYKSGKEETFPIKSFASNNCLLPATTKVYVMANNGTASAAEALMGVLVSNNVVDYSDIYISDYSDEYLTFSGTTDKNKRTYGKGIMQTPFTNKTTGEVLKLTTAQIYWSNGVTIHDKGVTVSDGCNAVKTDWVKLYGDPELKTVVNTIFS